MNAGCPAARARAEGTPCWQKVESLTGEKGESGQSTISQGTGCCDRKGQEEEVTWTRAAMSDL